MTAAAPRGARLHGLSLRAKLTLWFLGISVAIQLALSLLLLIYQRASVGSYFDYRLRHRAERMAEAIGQVSSDLTDDRLRTLSDEARRFVLSEAHVYTLYAEDGRIAASNLRPAVEAAEIGLGSRTAPSEVFLLDIQGLRGMEDPSQARAVLLPVRTLDGARYTLLMAISDSYYRSIMQQTARVILLSLPVGALAAAVAGWLIGGLAIRPFVHFRRLSETLAPESIERDVSPTPASREVVELERDLQETRAKLRSAFAAQDRFVSSVSHELKTPIATILLEGQTLHTAEMPPEAQRFVGSVTDEMRRLGRMTESFLTLARIRSGNAIPNPRPSEANEFVMEAIADCSRFARQSGVTLAPELAEDDRPLPVSGDAELLRVLVDNLVRNAVRFSAPGGAVVVRVIPEDGRVAISVRDRGPGIPPELLDRLFDRFVQGPDQSSRVQGHGLGLTIAQGIAELHGGRITVRNLDEGGCEFTVTLPLCAPAPEPGPDDVPAPEAGSAEPTETRVPTSAGSSSSV